jgi:cellulose synthase/poly-beta-1,6-N-acetylglucosamine synthase-like glycosyltransferase
MLETISLLVLVGLAMLYAAGLMTLRAGLRKLPSPLTPSHAHADETLPSVSIVVSARNEAHNLPRLLSCLTAQDYPSGRLEIVIVDDRSDDGTWSLLEEAARQHHQIRPIRVSDLVPDFAPKKRALDLAIRFARGEIILLTDADCTPPASWTRAMVQYYRDGVAGVVGYSPYRFDRPTPRLLQGMLALEYFSLFAVAAASSGYGRTLTASGTNFSYRRQVYLDAGGFEAIKHWISGDDDLFLHEVTRKGLGRFVFALDSRAYVPAAAPTSWRQFWHQRIRYASKGRQYGLAMTAGLVAVYLFNLFLVGAVLLGMAGLHDLFFGGSVLWVAKALLEASFLSHAAVLFREQNLLRYLIPTAIVHPFYVLLFGFLGLCGSFRWKGEAYHSTRPTTL